MFLLPLKKNEKWLTILQYQQVKIILELANDILFPRIDDPLGTTIHGAAMKIIYFSCEGFP